MTSLYVDTANTIHNNTDEYRSQRGKKWLKYNCYLCKVLPYGTMTRTSPYTGMYMCVVINIKFYFRTTKLIFIFIAPHFSLYTNLFLFLYN